MASINNDFEGVRRLVEVIGELEAFDWTGLFRRMTAAERAVFFRLNYWEEPDYLFLAVVKEIVDINFFTFIWRGRVLWARSLPDTSDLIVGEPALIRKLPASKEYVHIFSRVNAVVLVLIFANTAPVPTTYRGAKIFAYTLNPLASPVSWTVGVWDTSQVIDYANDGTPSFSPSGALIHGYENFSIDQKNSHIAYAARSVLAPTLLAGDPRPMIIRIDDWRDGVWSVKLTHGQARILTGRTTESDFRSTSNIHSTPAQPGFIATVISAFNAFGPGTPEYFVIHSHDYGNTWHCTSIASVIPPTTRHLESDSTHQWTLSIDQINPNIITVYGYSYDFSVNFNFPAAWIQSLDGGHTWSRIDNGLAGDVNGEIGGRAYVARPSPGYGYTYNKEVWKSQDKISWQPVTLPPLYGQFGAEELRIVSSDGQKIIIANHGAGFALSTDAGGSWTTDGFVNLISAQNPDIGVFSNGVYILGRNRAGTNLPTLQLDIYRYQDATLASPTLITGDLLAKLNAKFGMTINLTQIRKWQVLIAGTVEP